jgi:predicted negative regulator of RcsB-dependent stress response
MKENLFEAQYNITKKSKLKRFYESNKILIYSSVLILIIFFVSISLYLESKEKKRILLSENYVQAKIYLENGKKIEAINILKSVIFANDSTYSPLCFFLILNQDLISDFKEISILFEHLLENNKFDKEIRNLLVYKKALFDSNFVSESELLIGMKPLLNTQETLWKPHALLLLGDYFMSKGEYLKAREFYIQILSISNLHKDLYYQAKSQLEFIAND